MTTPVPASTVVHLLPQLRLGVGRYVVDTALEQRRTGLRVFVAVGTDVGGEWRSRPELEEELRAGGVGVLRAGDIFHRRIGSLLEAANSLRNGLPQDAVAGVAHGHTAMAAAVGRLAGIRTVVATCHGWNLGRESAFDLQDALAFRMVDRITSPSAYWARILEQQLGLKNIDVIPVGLDLKRYPDIRPAIGAEGRPRIVTLAELTDRKGIDDLLEAMPEIWQRWPAAELHLFGDGDRRAALESRARSLDRDSGRIVFHGFVSAPFPRMADADVFCLPSRSDNYPVALMEAMLARLPVVATDVGGIPELVTSSGSGRVVAARSPNALAKALTETLEMSAAERRQIGGRGEAFIREHCAIRVTVGRLAEIYDDAASPRAARLDETPGGTPCA